MTTTAPSARCSMRVVAALLLAVAVYGIVLPSLTPLFPSAEVARALRNVTCVGPKAAAAGYHEPSLVFMTGTYDAADRRFGRGGFPAGRAAAASRWSSSARSAASCSAPRRSGCATTWRPASTAIISRRAGRSRSRSSAPKAPSRCRRRADIAPCRAILAHLLRCAGCALAQLVRAPSHSRRAEAARGSWRGIRCGSRAARRGAIIALMCRARCLTEIRPDAAARHAGPVAGSHPHRFRQGSSYVLWVLAALLVAAALACAAIARHAASLLLGLGTRLQFVFFAVAVPVLVGEIAQISRRPRPAVCRRRGQRLQLRRRSTGTGPMPAFRPAMR